MYGSTPAKPFPNPAKNRIAHRKALAITNNFVILPPTLSFCGHMNLIIDIGNTIAKLVVFDENEPIAEIHTSNQTLEALPDIIRQYPALTRGIVSSVIDLSRTAQQQLEALPFKPIMLDGQTPVPIRIGYRTPQTLGADRLAAAVGAMTLRPGHDLLVIDAGTCITYEFVDHTGCYHGGNISPGLEMRLTALHEHTAHLPLVHPEGETPQVGYDTETAIRTGVISGIRHEIEGYIREFQTKYPDISIFLTGGNIYHFDTPSKNCIFADKFLVPRGLNRILLHNQ